MTDAHKTDMEASATDVEASDRRWDLADRSDSARGVDSSANMGVAEKLQVIDLTGIIRSRVSGWKGRLIPRFLLRGLERLICQRELNEMLRYAYPSRGSEFASKLLDHLEIKLHISGLENLPDDEPFIFASNHPLGGLDGIALVSVLGSRYGDSHIGVLVNDMLMNVAPLRDVFLPVNKYGRQGRGAAERLRDAYMSGRQMVIFPAGLVSRLGDDGKIRDLPWHKYFVTKALEYGRRIVPIHFEALNSMRFYRAARLRKKCGLKINLEQALLPSELVRCRGKEFRIAFGTPVDVLSAGVEKTPVEIAAILKTDSVD